ncbi:hypothetical protein LMG7974_00618 [Campylobacter majalis]|uniref:Ornithine carbamoyltransferase n=1 Tax=Campylobacter majalis TaxID=2790656 RepID=A0ABN7KAD8_9BACT|nr:ornithine carbamoyltransferase [Campylobacter majalis]CAD7287737.1 hypothetical protein LMG7974_00618 [Campylobacter majalis]
MKISIECECVLLKNTLLLFCKEYLSKSADCDFIISDKKISTKKPLFLIADSDSHMSIPFSKRTLFENLNEFYSAIQVSQGKVRREISSGFETRLDEILNRFRFEILSLVKEYK